MESPSTTGKPRRSRNGCLECRRLHRKCDETQPSCLACRASRAQCKYGINVKWGGRPFTKSTFGKCLNQSVALLPTDRDPISGTPKPDGGFVYGISTSQRPINTASMTVSTNNDSADVRDPDRNEILQNPSHLQHLKPSQQLLLDHFVNTVTRSFSLHAKSHHGFCTTYLTLSLHISAPVLPAVLEASALHRKSLGLNHDDRELLSLRQASIHNLRVLNTGTSPYTEDIAIATALMLCLCDILAGGEKTGSWTLHLQAAIAISRQSRTSSTDESQMSTQRRFLYRWCESLEVLSLLSPTAFFNDEAVEDEDVDSDYIDEFHGFSRSLVNLIRQSHLLFLEQQSFREALVHATGSPQVAGLERLSRIIQARCRVVIRQLKTSLQKDEPSFHPGLQSSISDQTRYDFVAVNAAFHHAVLLQLYRRVQGCAWDDPSVEASTEAILKHLAQLHLREEACPGVAILQPLFDAGCSSIQDDHRQQVLDLMDVLEKRYAMGNVSRAKAFLQEYWQEWDDARAHGGDLHWGDFLSERLLERFKELGLKLVSQIKRAGNSHCTNKVMHFTTPRRPSRRDT